MMKLANRQLWQCSSTARRAVVHRPQYRSIFSGINKFLDEKFPNEASSEFSQPALMVAPVLLTHGVLGSLLSYPVIAEALTREQGIVGSIAGDWDIIETSFPLSVGFMLSGMVSSVFGGTIANMGPRKALLGSTVCIGSGLAVSAVGVYMQMLPLLYFGFGTSVGAGVGLCYASPIQTLMHWFPENKGICGGVAASAIGLGAVLSREGLEGLLKRTATLPEYLGPLNDFEILGEGKSLTVEVQRAADGASETLSVVAGGGADAAAAAVSLPTLQEGLYLVGEGSTGAAGALAAMSVLSFGALAASAMLIRTPPQEYIDDSLNLDDSKSTLFMSPLLSELTSRESKSVSGSGNMKDVELSEEVNFFTAVRSRNFHVLGAMLACTATSGVGLLTLSDAIMMEEFSRAFPELITPTFLDNHMLGLCAAGIFGAGFWSSLSDFVGSRKALVLMYFLTSPAFLALPYCASLANELDSSLPVFLSVGAAALAVTSLGGIVATMPAYCAELYGTKNVTAILGGTLAYSTLAATFAPYLYVKLHQLAEQKAAIEILSQVSPDKIQQAFNCSVEGAQGLVQSGAFNLAEVFALAPLGTADPMPFLYDTTLYSFAGLMTISALSNSLIVEPQAASAKALENFSPYTPLPEKVQRSPDNSGKQYTDRRKKKKQ